MTYEELCGSQRQLSSAMLIPSLVWPGSLHMMAGEVRAGWANAAVGAVGLGLATIGFSKDDGALLATGVAFYLGGLIYDWVHGARVIKEKRMEKRMRLRYVRYRYGW